MADDSQVADDLFQFARALVRKLKRRYSLAWSDHRTEDAEQELFLAGWQVWRDQRDLGFAKNRMANRRTNLLRDYFSEKRHEPKPAVTLPEPDDDEKPGVLEREERRVNPVEEAAVREFLNGLSERRRQIVLLRIAGFSDLEIADELGLSERTVERELQNIRKEHGDDHSTR